MISWLKGVIREIEPMRLLVDVNNVGYEVFVPLTLQESLQKGKVIEIYVYTHMKESQITLYGFPAPEDRELFLQLIKVQGVGPRSALSVLSHIERNRLIQAIAHEEARILSKIPGIGKKTSQRIITELKAWVNKHYSPPQAPVQKTVSAAPSVDSTEVEMLFEALQKLGYKRRDIGKEVDQVVRDMPDATATEWLHAVLKRRGQSL